PGGVQGHDDPAVPGGGHRVGAPRGAGPAHRMAGRPVPRDPGDALEPADGRPGPAGPDAGSGPETGAGETASGGRRALRALSVSDQPTLRSRMARSRRTFLRSRSLRPPQIPNFSPISMA